MKTYLELSKAELKDTLNILEIRYNDLKSRNLALDMTRGKPSPDQLDLANEMPGLLDLDNLKAEDGSDCRNYGVPFGLKESRALFGKPRVRKMIVAILAPESNPPTNPE